MTEQERLVSETIKQVLDEDCPEAVWQELRTAGVSPQWVADDLASAYREMGGVREVLSKVLKDGHLNQYIAAKLGYV